MYPYLAPGERKPQDFYPTPPEPTLALIQFLAPRISKNADMIWEPACGEGSISKVLTKQGYNVSSSDLYEYEWAQGKYGADFLKTDSTSCSWIITNPPFNTALDFIRQCDLISRRNPNSKGFVLLLKSNFWNVKRNVEVYNSVKPSYVLPLTWRPDFLGNGRPVLDMNWNVWLTADLKSREAVPTEFIPLAKPIIVKYD